MNRTNTFKVLWSGRFSVLAVLIALALLHLKMHFFGLISLKLGHPKPWE